MKLVRFGDPGAEQPGVLDSKGRLRSLRDHVADITAGEIARIAAQIAQCDCETLPLVDGNPRIGIPIAGIGKIVAIGLNYRDHAIESNLPIPTEPIMFMKSISSLNGPNDDVMLPPGSTASDWEVELGVVIGRRARHVAQADAMAHIAGFVLVNDVSERFNQKERGSQWSKGKGHDTFCPVGPWLVTPDEIDDPMALAMWLDVNGVGMQTGNTGTMIFSLAELISYVSRFITLEPGDLLITGTPPGVGEGKRPDKIFLKPGDVMALGIDGLGTQRQHVIAFDPSWPENRDT